MRFTVFCAGILAVVAPLGAQQRDSVARADSAARADSVRMVRELEALQSSDSAPPRRMSPQQAGAANRLLPDISAIGDFIFDGSPKGSTQEDGTRAGVREVELAVGANVDPYFRVDFILGISDLEGIGIEEAYGTAVALPGQLQARIGRFHMPFGKQNTTHRAELLTVEYPWVLQQFLGPEGLKGTGLWGSRILSPLGFYQELQVTVVDAFGEAEEALVTEEPANQKVNGLAYSARLRNYFDLSEAANFEVSGSVLTGKRAQPLGNVPPSETVNAVNARQTVLGVDATFRWRPLQQGLYKSFILQAELLRQLNRVSVTTPPAVTYDGPTRDYTGGYVLARMQLSRRTFLGARFDAVQDAPIDPAGGYFKAGSAYLQFFPSEFSKIVAAFERTSYPAGSTVEGVNRILLQTTFSVGPHRPHPF